MKKDRFEEGREYERLDGEKNFHLFFGYASVVVGLLVLLFSFYILKTKLAIGIVLIIMGIMSLYFGYSEKKELKMGVWKSVYKTR